MWTLEWAAEVSFEHGLTPECVSREAVRTALQRCGGRWKRAKQWITSPDPEYARKRDCGRLIELASRHRAYALGFQDEVWWSRVTQPNWPAWAERGEVLRLIQQTSSKDDADPKALACYGLTVSCPAAADTLAEQVWRRFVEKRPLSAVTTQYLAWCCQEL